MRNSGDAGITVPKVQRAVRTQKIEEAVSVNDATTTSSGA
jgi:hypothetical protein